MSIRAGTSALVLWLAVFGASHAQPLPVAPPTRVLVIYSYDRLLPAHIEGDRGFRAAIGGADARRVEVFEEYLDGARFPSAQHGATLVRYLHDKYAAVPPGILVAGGGDALEFALRHRPELFPEATLVHMGVERTFLASISPLPKGVVGVPYVYDYAGTIRQALAWHPGAERLILVTGASTRDREDEAWLRKDLARLGIGIEVEYLAGLPTTEVLQRVAALDERSVVFTPGYFEDGTGRYTNPRDAAAEIAAVSGAPVYGPFITFLGSGVVGGRMPSFDLAGRQGGEIVKALIAGTPPEQLKLPAALPTEPNIDWRQAVRWGIDASDLPAGTVVHFRAPGLWDAYRGQVIAALLVILVLAGLTTGLLVERRLLRRATAALRQSEARMNLATRAGRLAPWVWNMGPDRVSIGAATLSFSDAMERIHPSDRDEVAREVRKAAEDGGELHIEFRALRADGAVQWFALRGRRNEADEGQLLGVLLDITERKNLEIQAERNRNAVEHLSRVSTLGQMSASIAHQLNQPLAAILTNAEVAQKMLDGRPMDPAALREICADIVAQDQRAADVIRRLGALFRRGELNMQAVDANALARETLDFVRTDLVSRRITVVENYASPLPAVRGDRVQLQQVILNLVINAAEAMSERSNGERLLNVHTEATESEVRLQVSDTGPGISPDLLKKVFDPFWTTKAHGIGIGLAVCQSIVTAHHGSLTAANIDRGGAVFSVALPVSAHA